jgi:hypothetical protein
MAVAPSVRARPSIVGSDRDLDRPGPRRRNRGAVEIAGDPVGPALVEPGRHDRKEGAAAQIRDQPIGVIAADRGPEITCIGIVPSEALDAFVAEPVEIGVRGIRALDVAFEPGAHQAREISQALCRIELVEREIVPDQLVASALQVFAEGIPGLVGASLDLGGHFRSALARHAEVLLVAA